MIYKDFGMVLMAVQIDNYDDSDDCFFRAFFFRPWSLGEWLL